MQVEKLTLECATLIHFLFHLGILLALGSLVIWHIRMISRGETTIENLSNKTEREVCKRDGKVIVRVKKKKVLLFT